MTRMAVMESASGRRQFQRAVLNWYRDHQRQLPWRESADPYRIWVSEIMLQQTTVAAVVPYFQRFTDRFPDVASLATAEQDEVLRYWEGLGYYSRARNLHRAAQVIVNEHDGEIPSDASELQSLPGIGRYTAGAISSFAFKKPAPILEANTIRLYSRLMNLDLDPKTSVAQKLLWSFAELIVSPTEPADFNQAVMDLGSGVCRSQEPDCGSCPLTKWCGAFHAGSQARTPRESQKAAFSEITEVSVVIRGPKGLLLRQRTEGEWWSGLWDFARFRVTPESAEELFPSRPKSVRKRKLRSELPSQKSLFADDADDFRFPSTWQAELQALTGLKVSEIGLLTEIRHTVTRYRIRLICFTARVSHQRLPKDCPFQWFSEEDLRTLPLSKTGREQAQLVLPRADS